MSKVIGEASEGSRLFKVSLGESFGDLYVHALDETDAIRAARESIGLSYCAQQSAVLVDALPEGELDDELDGISEADAIRAELEATPGITNAEVVANLKAKDIIVKSSQVTAVRKALTV